jgi:excisionase family DNA binding protein
VHHSTTLGPSLSDQSRLAFTPAEAAQATSLSRTTIYRLVASGELRARRCGTRVLISRRALDDYLEADAS